MIVRILQLNVRPDRIQQFLEVIAARVQQGVQGADGLLGWEVLAPLEQPPVTVVITRWRDEDAVRTWAGPFGGSALSASRPIWRTTWPTAP